MPTPVPSWQRGICMGGGPSAISFASLHCTSLPYMVNKGSSPATHGCTHSVPIAQIARYALRRGLALQSQHGQPQRSHTQLHLLLSRPAASVMAEPLNVPPSSKLQFPRWNRIAQMGEHRNFDRASRPPTLDCRTCSCSRLWCLSLLQQLGHPLREVLMGAGSPFGAVPCQKLLAGRCVCCDLDVQVRAGPVAAFALQPVKQAKRCKSVVMTP